MSKAQIITLSDDDFQMLMYIWKWKVVTTTVLFERFAKEFSCGPEAIFKKLSRLKSNHYIKQVPVVKPRGLAWSIHTKGFSTLKEFLPELKADGFKSENPSHDLNVMAAHTSILERLSDVFENLAFYTEQEIRSVHDGCHPTWVPQNFSHHPDGYWAFNTNQGVFVIALETELSKKSSQRYAEILSLYNVKDEINSVLWVVEQESLARFIMKQDRCYNNESKKKQNFVILSDLLQNGVDAKCFAGTKAGQKLSEFLIPENFPYPFRKASLSGTCTHLHPAMNCKLHITNSTTYNNLRKGPDRD